MATWAHVVILIEPTIAGREKKNIRPENNSHFQFNGFNFNKEPLHQLTSVTIKIAKDKKFDSEIHKTSVRPINNFFISKNKHNSIPLVQIHANPYSKNNEIGNLRTSAPKIVNLPNAMI